MRETCATLSVKPGEEYPNRKKENTNKLQANYELLLQRKFHREMVAIHLEPCTSPSIIMFDTADEIENTHPEKKSTKRTKRRTLKEV